MYSALRVCLTSHHVIGLQQGIPRCPESHFTPGGFHVNVLVSGQRQVRQFGVEAEIKVM